METQSYFKSSNRIIVCIVKLLPKSQVMDLIGFDSFLYRE